MKNDSRQTHSHQMYSYIKQWQSSGLKQHEFCSQNGLTYSCFQYWRKKYSCKQIRSANFIPVNIDRQGNAPVEIHYPNGVQLRIPSTYGVFQLLQLVGRL